MKRRLLAAAFVLIASFLAVPAQPALAVGGPMTITLASGAGTQFFNGATWQAATAICTLSGAWAAPLAGSSYVGFPGTTCTTGLNEVRGLFRNQFQLPVGYQNASITVSWLADNSAQLFLNGTRIGGNVDDGVTVYFSTPTTTSSSDPSLFRVGTNELALELHNWGVPGQPQYGPNPTGLDFVAAVTFTPPTPFASFAAKAELEPSGFEVKGTFILGAGSDGIAPAAEAVALQVGSYRATIPAGSFKQDKEGRFKFEGTIGGVSLEVVIRPLGGANYELKAEGHGVSIAANGVVAVSLTVGNDTGSTAAPLDD